MEQENILKINKFNASWQLVRAQVKKLNQAHEKIEKVMHYLHNNMNVHDKDRVLNWLKMTKLGYNNIDARVTMLFNDAIEAVEKLKDSSFSKEDNSSKLSDLTSDQLIGIINDLKSRKYNFRFKGVIPKDHSEFMSVLQKTIDEKIKK
jgi:metal-dependent HD superfamily phosphatase/phosphodiesterase